MAGGSRRRRRSKVERLKNLVRRAVAFLFSHVGLCALLVTYVLLGSVSFRQVEGDHERVTQRTVAAARHAAIEAMWTSAYRLSLLYEANLTADLAWNTTAFRAAVLYQIRKGYDGKGNEPHWTFPGAFLYSLTVITTIGYGHVVPHTVAGKALTIVYAIVGIPLMLLFLTNIGDLLAQTSKFSYNHLLQLSDRLFARCRRRDNPNIRRIARATRAIANARAAHRESVAPMSGGDNAGVQERLLPETASHDSLEGMGPILMEMRLAMSLAAGLVGRKYSGDRFSVRQSERRAPDQPVPVSVAMLIMTLYLNAGALLFCVWENWSYQDAFYFCYISLSTIGFGDLVPGASLLAEGRHTQEKLVICSLYLLFGMALIAMCFNLAQEEVVNKFTRLAKRCGMFKPDHPDEV